MSDHEENLRRIRRELDDDLERRRAAREHPHAAEHAAAAAAKAATTRAAEMVELRGWVVAAIEAERECCWKRLEDLAVGTGKAIRHQIDEASAEIEAAFEAKLATLRNLKDEILAETSNRMAAAEAAAARAEQAASFALDVARGPPVKQIVAHRDGNGQLRAVVYERPDEDKLQ